MDEDLERKAVDAITLRLTRAPGEGGLSPGDRAALRRMAEPWPGALWRLFGVDAVAAWLDAVNRSRGERALALLVQAAAQAGTLGGDRVGRTLALTGYAEARLVRLLRADTPEEMGLQAGLVARWCAAKGVALRLNSAGGLAPVLLAGAMGWPSRPARAQAVARDFYAFKPDTAEPEPDHAEA